MERALDDWHVSRVDDLQTTSSIRSLLQELAGDRARDAVIEVTPLRGGLETARTALATARYHDAAGRPRLLRFVVKELEGRSVREALVYEQLVSAHAADMSPALLRVERLSPAAAVLYLEAIRRTSAWAWRDLSIGRALLRRLAGFHNAAAESMHLVPAWDYEAEHRDLALKTRTALDRCRRHPDLAALARELPAVDRIVLARDRLRRQLLAERPVQARPIHGDVHPGNALVRRRNNANQPVLLDWGRARVGSPFEDVASWIHSLGFWETEARRRHDTLLADYLGAYGIDRRLVAHVRAAYWLAGASNAIAGALLHHVETAGDATQRPARRACAFRAAQAWLRVIRRADAWWS